MSTDICIVHITFDQIEFKMKNYRNTFHFDASVLKGFSPIRFKSPIRVYLRFNLTGIFVPVVVREN